MSVRPWSQTKAHVCPPLVRDKGPCLSALRQRDKPMSVRPWSETKAHVCPPLVRDKSPCLSALRQRQRPMSVHALVRDKSPCLSTLRQRQKPMSVRPSSETKAHVCPPFVRDKSPCLSTLRQRRSPSYRRWDTNHPILRSNRGFLSGLENAHTLSFHLMNAPVRAQLHIPGDLTALSWGMLQQRQQPEISSYILLKSEPMKNK